jgi:hypothetical protein
VALSDWLFKQRGVLRAKNIHHYLKSDKSTPRFYTVKEDIVRKRNSKKAKRLSWVFLGI